MNVPAGVSLRSLSLAKSFPSTVDIQLSHIELDFRGLHQTQWIQFTSRTVIKPTFTSSPTTIFPGSQQACGA